MARTAQAGKKLCPAGVPADCLYCIQYNGRAWDVLDPKDNPIDEAKGQKQAIDVAEGYIAQCNASRAGYGNMGPTKFDFGAGLFKWKGKANG